MLSIARFTTALAASLALGFVDTSVAAAASPPITRQAAAANAAFLAYAPPPAGGALALCLVDTGVDETPDTAPGLVAATALDGGTGDDVDPLRHGTIDAAIAGGSGHGVLGAWPQLKIVSVRATDNPSPGQLPSYQWDDYTAAITQCTKPLPAAQIAAIAIPLSSTIPPTPDQVDEFNTPLGTSRRRRASRCSPPLETSRARSSFQAASPGSCRLARATRSPAGYARSAHRRAWRSSRRAARWTRSIGLTPRCAVATEPPRRARSRLACSWRCGATRRQSPRRRRHSCLSRLPTPATSTPTAAFRAAGLGSIVDAGNAAVPKPPPPAPLAGVSPPTPASALPARLARPRVKRATWRRGVLLITLRTLPKGARLHAKVTFARRRAMFLSTSKPRLRARTPLPRRVRLQLTAGDASSPTVTLRVTRLRR